VSLQISDVRQLDTDTWLYTLGATKTDTAACVVTNRCAVQRRTPSPPGWK
jgi:hypothetical protein